MFTKTIDIDGVKATFRTETGRDVFTKRKLMARLGITTENPDLETWYQFVSSIAQGSDIETPFVWPDASDAVEDLQRAFEAWQDCLSGLAMRMWLSALEEVDTTPHEADQKNEVSQ